MARLTAQPGTFLHLRTGFACLALAIVCLLVAGCATSSDEPPPGANPNLQPPRLLAQSNASPLDVTLLDHEGRPIAGQLVVIRATDGTKHDAEVIAEAKTDAEGSCHFAKVPQRRVEVFVERGNVETLAQRMVNPGVTPRLTITVPRPGTINGVILDAAGKPLANVGVSLTNLDLWFVPHPTLHPSGETDADGRFQIEVPVGGWFRVQARSGTEDVPLTSWMVQIERGDSVTREFRQTATVTVQGVATRNGEPWSGPLDFLHIEAGVDTSAHAEAGDDGSFTVQLPAGDVLVSIARDMQGRRLVTVGANGGRLEVVIPIGELAGTVKRDGQPVSGLRVIARRVRPDRIPRGPDWFEQLFVSAETRTKEDGGYLLAGLSAGRYELWTQPSLNHSGQHDLPFICQEVTLAEGATAVANFELPAAGSLHLSFAGMMGQPGSIRSQLDVLDSQGRRVPWLIQRDYRSWAFARFSLTLPTGARYDVHHQPAGGASPWAGGIEVGELAKRDRDGIINDAPSQVVTATDGGRLVVTATFDGKPAAHAVWRIRDGNGHDITPTISFLVSAFDGSNRADADGRFVAAHLPPGVVSVEVESADGRHRAKLNAVQVSDGATATHELALE